MNLISGVLKEDYSDYVLYFVESLSDELKQEIRSRLSAVCHGVDQAQSAAKIYSYKETAKEFVKRYKSDKNASEKRKKGMIGELLVHIILEIEGRFTTASPFFNMEERSFKKGYDVALFEEKTNELWIAEVKSGEIQKNQKDASAAATGLINTAKNDLKVRLNDYNTSLWLNALNAAKVTMSDSKVVVHPEMYNSKDVSWQEPKDGKRIYIITDNTKMDGFKDNTGIRLEKYDNKTDVFLEEEGLENPGKYISGSIKPDLILTDQESGETVVLDVKYKDCFINMPGIL